MLRPVLQSDAERLLLLEMGEHLLARRMRMDADAFLDQLPDQVDRHSTWIGESPLDTIQPFPLLYQLERLTKVSADLCSSYIGSNILS